MAPGLQKSFLVTVCLMWTGFLKTVSLMDMMTDGQVFISNQGENLVLSCEFRSYNFDLFDNPVLWKKTQRGESVVINHNSNIQKPFSNTNRFGVTFMPRPPNYGLDLSILSLAQEDSGNYTCEIRLPEGAILGQVTHYVFVRAYVESLAITSLNTTDIPKHRHSVVYNEVDTKANILRCISIGGYPPPEMRVYVGSTDISDLLQWYQAPKLRGRKGLRLMTYYSERYSYNFKAEPQYDGMEITCAVNVQGYGNTNHTLSTMFVNYMPIIKCYDNSAELGELMVQLTCDIKAKPAVTSAHWILDNKGTTLAVNHDMHNYWTQQKNTTEGTLRVTLYLHKAEASSFRSYGLVAENAVGLQSHASRLIRIVSKPTPSSFEVIDSRRSNNKRKDFYIYRPARASSVSIVISQTHLHKLILSGTVLLLSAYFMHNFS